MGWWPNSKSEGAARQESQPHDSHPDTSADLEAAKDTLAAILRSIGDTAFGTEAQLPGKTAELAAAWARHVLVAAAPPGMSAIDDAYQRRWSGVLRFVSSQLRQRFELFEKATNDLREVAHALIHAVGNLVTETERSDQVVSAQLQRLREATDSQSIDRIREEAMLVVEQVGAAVASRRDRQRDELALLSGRIRHLRSQLEMVRKETEIDPLTKLANRRAFDQYVDTTVDFARLAGGTAILLFVDVDHFKKVNDVHGHLAGDKALRCLADVFVRTFPRRGDFMARYGGEEFCIVLRDVSHEQSERLANRLLDAVRKTPIEYEGASFWITASVGVACLRPGESAEEWVGRADLALYRAKAAGRDRACVEGETSAEPPKPTKTVWNGSKCRPRTTDVGAPARRGVRDA